MKFTSTSILLYPVSSAALGEDWERGLAGTAGFRGHCLLLHCADDEVFPPDRHALHNWQRMCGGGGQCQHSPAVPVGRGEGAGGGGAAGSAGAPLAGDETPGATPEDCDTVQEHWERGKLRAWVRFGAGGHN